MYGTTVPLQATTPPAPDHTPGSDTEPGLDPLTAPSVTTGPANVYAATPLSRDR